MRHAEASRRVTGKFWRRARGRTDPRARPGRSTGKLGRRFRSRDATTVKNALKGIRHSRSIASARSSTASKRRC